MRISLIDANNLYARAWYVVTKTSEEFPQASELIKQCLIMLKKIKRDYLPDCLFLCWDGSKDEERMSLYPEYKDRKKKSPEYYKVLNKTRKAIEKETSFITVYDSEREADDLIATLARYYDSSENIVQIITNDKDMFQLVTQNIVVIRPNQTGEKKLIDMTNFKKQFNFLPTQFVDYYSMRGDTSDNIPGAMGIGEKTAEKLISQYSSLEGIYKNLDNIAKGTREKLISSRKNVMLSRKLITLKTLNLGFKWMAF